MADPLGDGTFALPPSTIESGQDTMSFSMDGNIEAQKRALIRIVRFALNAGTFGVAALNVTLCNPCFLQRMCCVFANGISDLVHEFARCESRISYRELIVAFRSRLKGRGGERGGAHTTSGGGAARSHHQRGKLMVERGREQRKGQNEFEKEKRKAFEKTYGALTRASSALANRSAIGSRGEEGGEGGGASKPRSFFPSMPCSWQPGRCRKLQNVLSTPAWYQQACETEARVGKEEEALAAEALRVELQLIEAQKMAEDEVLKLINAQAHWARIAPREMKEALTPKGTAPSAGGDSSTEGVVGVTGAAEADEESTVMIRIRQAAAQRAAAQERKKRSKKATIASRKTKKPFLSIVIQEDGAVGEIPLHDAEVEDADDASARSESLKHLMTQLTPRGLPQLTPRPRRALLQASPRGGRGATLAPIMSCTPSPRGSPPSLRLPAPEGSRVSSVPVAPLRESPREGGHATLTPMLLRAPLEAENDAATSRRPRRMMSTIVPVDTLHPVEELIISLQTRCEKATAVRDRLMTRLAETMEQMGKLRVDSDVGDGAAQLDVLDIQNLAAHTQRQLRQFAMFLRSEAGILKAMPELFFQRCAHCVEDSAPETIGTYLLESGNGRTSYCKWLNKPLLRQKLAESDQQAKVSCLAWSPDAEMCAFGFVDGAVRVLDIPSMECIYTLSESGARKGTDNRRASLDVKKDPGISAMAFAQHNGWLAVGNTNGNIVIWDTTTAGAIVSRVDVHAARISGLAFNRNSKFLASSSIDTTLRIFHTGKFDEIARIARGKTQAPLESCAWSPDGKWIALSGADGEVTTYNATAPALEVPMHQTMIGHVRDKRVHMVCFDGSGTLLASASEDCTARVWDVVSGECVLILQGHQRAVSCCAFERLSDRGGGGGEKQSSTRERRASVRKKLLGARPARRLLTGSLDGLILLWDIKAGAVLRAMQKHTAAIYCCEFSPDNAYIASGSFDRTIKLWLGETGEEVDDGPKASTQAVADEILRGARSGGVRSAHHGGGGAEVRAQGRIVKASEKSSFTAVRLGTYKPQDENARENHHTDRITQCAFTPAHLAPSFFLAATGGLDTTIRLWDRETMCVLHELTDHSNSVTAICFADRLVGYAQPAVLLEPNAARGGDRRRRKTEGAKKVNEWSDDEDDIYTQPWAVLYTASDDGALYSWLLPPTTSASAAQPRVARSAPFLRHTLSGHHATVNTVILFGETRLGSMLSCDQSGLCIVWTDVLSENCPYPVATVDAAAQLASLSTISFALTSHYRSGGESNAPDDARAASTNAGANAQVNAKLLIFASNATVLELHCHFPDLLCDDDPIAAVAETVETEADAGEASAAADADIDIETRILMRGRALVWAPQSAAPLELKRVAPAAGSFAGGEVEHITSFALADNCLCLAAGTATGEVWFWYCDAADERCAEGEAGVSSEWSTPALLGAHFASVSATAFPPTPLDPVSGRKTDRPSKLVTGSDDKTAIVWCLELGVRLATFVTDGEVLCCNADSLRGWACGDTTGKLYLLNVEHIARGAVMLEVALQREHARVWFAQKCAIERHERLNIRISNFFRTQLSLVDVGKSLDPTNPQVRHYSRRAHAQW